MCANAMLDMTAQMLNLADVRIEKTNIFY